MALEDASSPITARAAILAQSMVWYFTAIILQHTILSLTARAGTLEQEDHGALRSTLTRTRIENSSEHSRISLLKNWRTDFETTLTIASFSSRLP